jgi:SAM-dependent methyltransferase
LKRAGGEDPLVPPPRLHSVGDGDYRATGNEFLAHFRALGGLKSTDRVLDVGSGTGRMALPLRHFLTSGTYDGIDIVRPSIEWCRRAYDGNFRFHHADIYNKYYNPDGKVAAGEYRFPFPDRSFDFVFLTSVFTHMLPDDVRHYLSEIERVSDGRVFMTAFLLNGTEKGGAFSFGHELDGCFVEEKDVPERAVAYMRDDFLQMVEDAGLIVEQTHEGTWRGTEGPSFQDFVIARRA